MKANVEIRELQKGTDELSVRLTAETPEEKTKLFKIYKELDSSKKRGVRINQCTYNGDTRLSSLTLDFKY